MKKDSGLYAKVEGHFLLARLNVRGIFARSVVWVYEFSEKKGAKGLILNRPIGRNLGSCIPTFSGTPLSEIPVFEGGPVNADRLCFLMRSRTSVSGKGRIKLGISPEEIRASIYNPGVRVYGFAGRAEWVPGQLENEIRRGTWMRVRMDVDAWDEGGSLDFWKRLVSKIRKTEAELMLRAPKNLSDN